MRCPFTDNKMQNARLFRVVTVVAYTTVEEKRMHAQYTRVDESQNCNLNLSVNH